MQNDFQLSHFAAELRNWFRRSALDPASLPFEDLAAQLFALQFERNLAYRRICESRGVAPGGLRSWREIPAVPTAAFKEIDLTSLPVDGRIAVFHSSGTTTGSPSRHFHSYESLALYESSVTAWFQPHLLPGWFERQSFANLLALTPPPDQAPNSSLVHMLATVRREFGDAECPFVGRCAEDGSWTLDIALAADHLRLAETSGEPLLVLGTALSFVQLADELAARGLRFSLPAGSRAMETGGYKGRSRELPRSGLHGAITRQLSIPASHIVSEYGMSELSSQAYACDVSGVRRSSSAIFQFPPWCRPSVISTETNLEVHEGETGLLRVFDLANVWSVMAIQTGDLAIRCGDAFELLGRAPTAEPRGCSLMNTA